MILKVDEFLLTLDLQTVRRRRKTINMKDWLIRN